MARPTATCASTDPRSFPPLWTRPFDRPSHPFLFLINEECRGVSFVLQTCFPLAASFVNSVA